MMGTIVSIHQPQYLPWLPYFLKVDESDLFILLDSVDFQKNGLQNRNQIKTSRGAQWLTVPVKQKLGQKISEAQIDNQVAWKKKHWQTIQYSYGKAAAFKLYAEEIEDVFSREWSSLNELNIYFFTLVLHWLGIEKKIRRSSEMAARGSGSELVLNLCLEVGAKQYVSGIGGHNYLDEAAFRDAGIEIVYRSAAVPEHYPQMYPQAGFISSLSVLDIILNCGREWRKFLPGVQGET
jgi:hypothetical protein